MSHGHDHDEELARRMAEADDPWALLEGEGKTAESRELRELEARLKEIGAEERRSIREAEDLTSAPGDDLVESTLREAAGQGSSRRTGVPLGLAFATAIAAAVLVYLGIRTSGEPSNGDPPHLLGGGEIVLLAPLDEVEDFSTFDWEAERPELGAFVVTIFADDGTPVPPVLMTSESLTESRWTPTAEELGQLPDRILWEVTVISAAGERGPSKRAASSRR